MAANHMSPSLLISKAAPLAATDYIVKLWISEQWHFYFLDYPILVPPDLECYLYFVLLLDVPRCLRSPSALTAPFDVFTPNTVGLLRNDCVRVDAKAICPLPHTMMW